MTIERTTSYLYGLIERAPEVLPPGTVERNIVSIGKYTRNSLIVEDHDTVTIKDELGIFPDRKFYREEINRAWLHSFNRKDHFLTREQTYTWRPGNAAEETVVKRKPKRALYPQTRRA